MRGGDGGMLAGAAGSGKRAAAAVARKSPPNAGKGGPAGGSKFFEEPGISLTAGPRPGMVSGPFMGSMAGIAGNAVDVRGTAGTDARRDAVPVTEPRGFLDPRDFPFVRTLERSAPAIRAELDGLGARDGFVPWPEQELYDEGWEVFGLYSFGRRLPANCAKCPRTEEAVLEVPGLRVAGFSRLAAGTHIHPHRGDERGVLRCHLGLVTPPDTGLRVDGETRTWEQGRCLVFDDTYEHEAWNRSGDDRVVLLIDFAKE